MEKKGFQVKEAKTVIKCLEMVKTNLLAFAVVDLRLEDGNGLRCCKGIQSKKKLDARIVMLTGYGNITYSCSGG